MTNRPMLSVERELLERAVSAVIVARGPGSPTERDLRAILDKPADQHQGEPVVPIFAKGCTVLESGNGKYRIVTSYQNRIDAWADYEALCRAEQPAPVAVIERCFHCNQPGGQCCTTAGAQP